MTWKPNIPPIPPEIQAIGEEAERELAETAWIVGQTLLAACRAWENWVNLTRVDYAAGRPLDLEQGDAIAQAGAAAIRTLCRQGIPGDTFVGDGEHLLEAWPKPPSECLDPAWYGDPASEIRKEVDRQLLLSCEVLPRATQAFLDDLALAASTGGKLPVGKNKGGRNPNKSAKGGRPVKWDKLLELHDKMKDDDPEALLWDIAKKYNSRYAVSINNGIRDEATEEALKNALSHRKRKQGPE